MPHATRTNDVANARVGGSLARGSNQTGMRAHNERLVLSLIRQTGPMPKAAIARLTGLSAQTVSVIMRALEVDGFLQKGDPVRGKVGQPSVPMGLDPDGAFFLGLKIGRRRADLVLIDFLGQVKNRILRQHSYPTPDGVMQFANDAIAELVEQMPEAHRARVAGLGIALPFRLWDWSGQLDHAAPGLEAWRDRDIAAEVGAHWDFPVYLCNDASAACSAELVFGVQDKPRDFLYFYVSYFVGGGLVLDNALYTGKTGNAAALGSVPVTLAGEAPCQLVDVASLGALEVILREHGLDRDLIWNSSDQWHVPQDLLTGWLERAAQGIAQAIVSSTCVIDFQAVLIDGSMPPDVRSDLVDRVARHLNGLTAPGIEFPEIREGTIGRGATSLGAASLPLSDRFLVDRSAYLKG